MKKVKKSLLLMLVSVFAVMCMPFSVFASENLVPVKPMQESKATREVKATHINLLGVKEKIYYKGANKGENISFGFEVTSDPFKNGDTKAQYEVYNENLTFISKVSAGVTVNGYFKGYNNVSARLLSNGYYAVLGVLYDNTLPEVQRQETQEETDALVFKIATLKAPTRLKAKAGKKKVSISYKKATGAKKYYIYRSTKKSSGYKKVKTTSSSKYTDKKVKKGKKYYYKVKSVRGSVVSSNSKTVKTKAVKR